MLATATEIEIGHYVEEHDKETLLSALAGMDGIEAHQLGLSGADYANTLVTDGSYNAGFVARVRSKTIGYAWASYKPYQGRASLQQCYVMPQYRGNGVAGALIDKRLAFIRDRWQTPNGIYALTYSNPGMESLLQKRGFECMGTWKDWVVAGSYGFLDESLWVLK